MNCGFLLILLYIFVVFSNGEILLATMPTGISHTGSFLPLIRRMESNGHDISLYMEAYNGSKTFNLKDRMIWMTEPDPCAPPEYEHVMWTEGFTVFTMMFPNQGGSDSCRTVLETPRYREHLMSLARSNLSLIMTDSLFASCGYTIASLNKAHHVFMHSSNVETAQGSMKAHGINFMLIPRHYMPIEDANFKPEQFHYRFTGAVEWWMNYLINGIYNGWYMKNVVGSIVPGFSYQQYIADSSMSFTDMPLEFYVPTPRTNDLFTYGAHCPSFDPLPADLEAFVSDPTSKGTIYIAFGTVINWKAAPREKFEAIYNAVASLTDYRVLWAYNGLEVPNVPKHIIMRKWMPQKDILQHNKTMLFYSHGGLKSVKEAACAATPAIFMPMFAEQVRNGWLVVNKGMAELVDKKTISKESLRTTMLRVMRETSYAGSAVRVRAFIRDHIIPPLDEGAHIVDRLLKHGGRMPELFYPKAIQHHTFTYLSLDVIALFVGVIAVASQ